MSAPLTPLLWLMAALPILALLILLVGLNWPVVRAAAVGAALSMTVAAGVFRAPWELIADQSMKGAWNSLSIMAVILPAILIYELGKRSGAYTTIQSVITTLIPDKLLQVLALGWCFPSFLQGPSGFGVPVAVCAPLLVGIGVRPLWAVFIPLLAHAWANTFGTMGMAWEILLQQVALDPATIADAALWTGVFTWMLNALSGALICWLYAGGRGLAHGARAVLLLSLTMGGGQLLLALWAPALAVVIPTTLSLGVVFWLGGRSPYKGGGSTPPGKIFEPSPAPTAPPEASSKPSAQKLGLHQAMLPYYLLVVLSLVVLLTPPLTSALGQWKMGLAFPETRTSYGFVNSATDMYGPTAWLTHSGFFLLVSALLALGCYLRRNVLSRRGVAAVLGSSLHKFVPAAVSVLLLVATSKVMGGSGQIDVLARGTAAFTGKLYGLLCPMVGVLGAFMSSSNVSSNILFSKFQHSMAAFTHHSEALILAAQTSGGAIGTMLAPSKVLLGTTTAGILGAEGEIIRKLLPAAAVTALLFGLLVLAFG